MKSTSSPWFVRFRAVGASPRGRLFCFPYAGGSARWYAKWTGFLPSDIDVCAIELPGHGVRMRERPVCTTVSSLVERLSTALSTEHEIGVPFFFFGHSMGALLAFLCARALRCRGFQQLEHLFVSGRLAPHKPNPDSLCTRMSDRELVGNLRKRGGITPQVLAEPGFIELFLPTIRADFALLDSHVYVDEPPLSCPITAYGGTRDETVDSAALAEWSSFTDGPFDVAMFEGGHFFVDTCLESLVAKVSYAIERALGVGSDDQEASVET